MWGTTRPRWLPSLGFHRVGTGETVDLGPQPSVSGCRLEPSDRGAAGAAGGELGLQAVWIQDALRVKEEPWALSQEDHVCLRAALLTLAGRAGAEWHPNPASPAQGHRITAALHSWVRWEAWAAASNTAHSRPAPRDQASLDHELSWHIGWLG